MYPNSMSDQSDSGGRSPYGSAYGQQGFNPQPNAPKPYPVQPGTHYGYIGHYQPQPANPQMGYGDQAGQVMQGQYDQQQQASIEKIRALEAQSRRSGPIQQTDAPPRLY